MELSTSWETANCASTQKIRSILWNARFIALVPILYQINPIYTTPSYLLKSILILSTHLRLGLPSGLFPSGFLTNILYEFLFSPSLFFLDLIVLFILSKEHQLWVTSLRNFLQSPVTSSLFRTNIHLSTMFSHSLSLCSSINAKDHVLSPYRMRGKIIVLYILIFVF
jgi:hypothetical protein